jgi:hypothetical protein
MCCLDILSQIFGTFMASLLVMGMYREQIVKYEEALTALGMPLVSATGPAGIFCSFAAEGQSMRLSLIVSRTSHQAQLYCWIFGR